MRVKEYEGGKSRPQIDRSKSSESKHDNLNRQTNSRPDSDPENDNPAPFHIVENKQDLTRSARSRTNIFIKRSHLSEAETQKDLRKTIKPRNRGERKIYMNARHCSPEGIEMEKRRSDRTSGDGGADRNGSRVPLGATRKSHCNVQI